MHKHSCRGIAALIFPVTTITTAFILQQIQYTQLISITTALFTAAITTGIWLETSYRFLVKEATAPLDKLVENA